MGERSQPNRWRCLVVGCNPVLIGASAATEHRGATGHGVAKWPQRSAAGKGAAAKRNRTGYYDQYNVGEKSAEARGLRGAGRDRSARGRGVPLTGDDFSIDNAGPFGG
jgi:hypothetical protein